MSIQRRLAAPHFGISTFNRALDCGVYHSYRSAKVKKVLSLLIGLAFGAVMFAVGLFFAFSFGMAHGDGTRAWSGTVARVLWWPAMLLPQPAGGPLSPVFWETTFGWALVFTLIVRLRKKKSTPKSASEPTPT